MAKVELTVSQIMNLGLWDRVCEYKGWNPYILNEGRIDEDEVVTFDDTFEKPKEPLPSEDIVFQCRKCEHHLYVTIDIEILRRLAKSNCPNCGREYEDNLLLVGVGNAEEDRDKFKWME